MLAPAGEKSKKQKEKAKRKEQETKSKRRETLFYKMVGFGGM